MFRRCMVGKRAAMAEWTLSAEYARLPTLHWNVWWRLASYLLRHDQILPFIHARDLAWADYGRAIELVEDGRSLNGEPHIEAFALIDRARDRLAVKAGVALFPKRILKRCTSRLEPRHRDRRHFDDAAHPIRHNLDRLFGRVVAEHQLMLRIEGATQRSEIRIAARPGDLVALTGIAHVKRALDGDRGGRKSVLVQLFRGHCLKPCKHGV